MIKRTCPVCGKVNEYEGIVVMTTNCCDESDLIQEDPPIFDEAYSLDQEQINNQSVVVLVVSGNGVRDSAAPQ